MKKITSVFYLLIASFFFCVVDGAYGLDPPHDLTSGMFVSCWSCHPARGSLPAAWLLQPATGDNVTTNLCLSCHHAGNSSLSDTRYKDIKTHSSSSGKYGSWIIDCTVCHESHNQRQAYYLDAVNTGVLTGITSTLLMVDNLLQASAYAKYLVAPNSIYPSIIYRIKDNTPNAIMTTAWPYVTWGAGPGNTYAIKYGKFINDQIVTSLGTLPVRFFNFEGPNSFAASSSVVDGVCQVCHAKTASFKKDGTLEGPDHPAGTAGKNCMQCHPHSTGFQAVMQ